MEFVQYFFTLFVHNIEQYIQNLLRMSNSIIKSESEDAENQVLLPISNFFPPNQIITKKYAPDVKPAFKLIIQQKKEKRKVTINTQQKLDFCQGFNENDTLGYQYSTLLKKQLVYLKFNNSAFMKIPSKGKQCKYLAGVFIPLEKIISQNLKKQKNIFKTLPNIDYIDNRSPVDNSFASNCYSEGTSLKFSSNYESSNLFAAVRIGQSQYDLILQNDINSKGNTQWFNFTVQINQEKTYKFNIANLTKSTSLYQKGMSIVYYSQATRIVNRSGWTRGCHNISYSRTGIARQDSQNSFYYKLHFQYTSNFKNDVVTFSYCFPYTLLDLQKFFNKIMLKRMINSLKIEKIKIVETLTGFPLNIYSISNRKHLSSKKSLTSVKTLTQSSQTNTPSLIFMARQHPGESQSSYVLEGVVEWLLQSDYDGWKKNFNFYIIPMVNMDGVYYGNYRTNLSGNDLNRVWRQPRKDYHCQIYSLKKFLHSLNKISPISLIVDIHGHSNSLNSFFYGNPPKKEGENPKLFPYFCSRKVKQISYMQSTFSISEDKKSCARVVLAEMFPKALVYTFQNSFYGWRKGKYVVEHTIESYKKLGRQLVQCYVQYSRLCEKTPTVKDRWVKQIDQISKDHKNDDEEVLTQSDDEIDNQLVELIDSSQPQLDTSLNKQLAINNFQRQKGTPSIGKTKFVKYLRRHSPIKLRNYCSNSNDTYVIDKPSEVTAQSQGFLSIVKINTRSNIESATQLDHHKLIEIKNNIKRIEQKRDTLKDQIMEDGLGNQGVKENLSQKYIKVGKLITEKQMVMEKLKQKRQKIQEGLLHSKTFNGFFRYNLAQKG